jgi:nitroreductase
MSLYVDEVLKMIHTIVRKSLAGAILVILCGATFMPALGTEGSAQLVEPPISSLDTVLLPPPLPVNMSLECAFSRRMSVRNFSEDPVTTEELSTVLWAAYGYTSGDNRTIHGFDDVYAAEIYVFTEEAIYRYDAVNHSLIGYKQGDYRADIAQYEAPIQLGLMWNTTKSSNENITGAEIGEIGQNIQFMAVALDLGTVVTADRPSPLDSVGLPPNEKGRIVMPLGHPAKPYNFKYRPLLLSLLPHIKDTSLNLTAVIQNRSETTSFAGELTRQQLSQLLWASYGYSYLLDKSEGENNPIKRHRTVPSAHGYYPLRMYAVTSSGVYRYIPGLMNFDKWGLPIVTFLMKIRTGDKRGELANASQPFVASAPLSIISVLDIKNTIKWDDLSGENVRWLWYYEAGASAYNVLLEATAWNLSGTIGTPTDSGALRSLLRLNESYAPLFVVPVGT